MKIFRVGVDIGSTTIKVVVLDIDGKIIYSKYQRHFSDIKNSVLQIFEGLSEILSDTEFKIIITGSGGMLVSEFLDLTFVQEVIASSNAIEKYFPKTNVAIELGGEDAKITYFGATLEQRMNGVCAGGTGAFIDQMAILLDTDVEGLNNLAKESSTIYPIASRCGVFAKTDIQPLINEGTPKSDIAVSILQAVVNQTISGLACGKPIRGNVAFLGGPLHFLSELRNRFIYTLNLKDQNIIIPENSHYFVALGAALLSEKEEKIISYKYIKEKITNINKFKSIDERNILPVLFKDEDDYLKFKERHNKEKVKRKDLSAATGKAFLGIDAGSTTTKLVLIDEEGSLLHSYYSGNGGSPLNSTINALKELYLKLPKDLEIVNSAITGYGEQLIKKALQIDLGEIETIAHYKSAEFFLPGVDFVIDIGGQDMKSLKIKDGFIESIMLNEACSSGCGSFIETFAKSLGMDVIEFSKTGLFAKQPIDLGTRCTVFMNSKVKQAQKEGSSVADISAGISYSVIKNALYKVIRLKNVSELGEKVVVQGGTFYNDSVLRSFETIINKNVIRPDIAGLMGAFGSALIAKENYVPGYKKTLIEKENLDNFTFESYTKRCEGCGNKCLLTISEFSDKRKYITGNRCERGLGEEINSVKIPNMFDYKYKRVFSYKPLKKEDAFRGVVGIPRVLNMYENFQFWNGFFEELKFRVVLSSKSSKEIFKKGMESIPSESICYPAKIVHGHIVDLIEKKVDFIFYPCLPYEQIENKDANNHFNCPIVTSYPETILANVDELQNSEVDFMNPFLPFDNVKRLKIRLFEEFAKFDIKKSEIENAVDKAFIKYYKYKEDVRKKGESLIKYMENNNLKGIVLAGRPYHIDPEINHGIPKMISDHNLVVFTEDSICHLKNVERPLRVVDQWTYHSRLYDATSYVATRSDMEVVQLNSFGCGLDAVTTDQVQEILHRKGKIYTLLKIDEISNLGAARIRIRSLIAVMNERSKKSFKPQILYKKKERVIFTKKMSKKHTILAPQMSPIHFELFEKVFNSSGYNFELLPYADKEIINEGLKYVNNDACYPSVLTIGQVMYALNSGNYDLNNVSVMISQTGGGCRATNYIGFLRKALFDAGMDYIPVISLNAGGLEKNPGFSLNFKILRRLVMAMLYGDLFMKLIYKVRPYEKNKGETNEVHRKWVKIIKKDLESGNYKKYVSNIRNIVDEFDGIETVYKKKPKVGIVGEILVKFHPIANNNIVDFIESEGAEAVVPDLTDFFLYCGYNANFRYEKLSGKLVSKLGANIFINFIEYYRKEIVKKLKASERFSAPEGINKLGAKASELLSLGNQTGEGWFLTAEMIELLDSGVPNITCLQPFACLPNHITGKGMIKSLRKKFPTANIVPIDYDPGASEVNQINRIKLMLANAFKNIEES